MQRGKITKVEDKVFYIDDKVYARKKGLPFTPSFGMEVNYEAMPNPNQSYPNQLVATKVEQLVTPGAQSSSATLSLSRLDSEYLIIQDFFKNDSIHYYLISDLPDGNHKNVEEVGVYLSSNGRLVIPAGKTFNDKPLSINQLRKYYYKFQQIFEQKVDNNQKRISLLMLKANIEYSAKRLDIRRFAILMHNRIDLVVKSPEAEFIKNLEAFNRNFEALVAYYPTK